MPNADPAPPSRASRSVLVELKARFDERRNIRWARALEDAGVHVVYGLPGLKTHAKALLVVRREGGGVRHYVHFGTGNYHAKTARLYEDFGLFTADPEITADAAELFNALTGRGARGRYRKRWWRPTPAGRILARDRRDVVAHERGEDARIVVKMNSLVDPACIRALYGASQAGVPSRPQCPRHLLPAAGRRGRQREHPRDLGGRPLPRALAHLRVPARRTSAATSSAPPT